MTQPSSPRRATDEEIAVAWKAYWKEGVSARGMEAALNAVFALPSTHDEAIRDVEDETFQAGITFALNRLCSWMGVDPKSVTWDAATETVDGDVSAVIGNIMRAKMGEDWSPDDPADEAIRAEEREVVVTAPIMKAALEAWNDKIDLGLLAQLTAAVAAAFRARASSPRSVPAEGGNTETTKGDDACTGSGNFASHGGSPDAGALTGQAHGMQPEASRTGTKSAQARPPTRTPSALGTDSAPPGTVAPDGFVLVPIRANGNMRRAGGEALQSYCDLTMDAALEAWNAMISAAPSPPASETA